MSQESNQHRIDALRHEWRGQPTPRRTLQLAEEYRRAGEVEAALEVLRAGLEKHPGHTATRVALGRYLLETDRPREAREAFEQIALEDQTHLVANKLLVESHLELGEAREARDRLDLYSLLNQSDSDIEGFEARLAALEALSARETETARSADGSRGTSTGATGGLDGPAAAAEVEVVEMDAAAPAAEETPPPASGAGDLFHDVWAGVERKDYWEALGSDGIFALEPRPGKTRASAALLSPAERPKGPVPASDSGQGASAGSEAPPKTADEVVESTVTLGRLYLEQGHRADAGRVFQEVLARDPGNAAARAGLAAAESGSPSSSSASDLVAADLLSNLSDGSVIERRRAVLTAYLARLKPAAGGF